MSAASLPPVGIDPNLRKKASSRQMDKWRSDSKKAADQHQASMPFLLKTRDKNSCTIRRDSPKSSAAKKRNVSRNPRNSDK
ncbi:hypothetical protein L596_025914 [Steinernema carpocapsae]|uniref:Uncharacterized protein n=1 Tax=Steinernema carpocapsae TaxID=34508 RepID=A0A4U5MAR7_STECR|nr:hypothetical protein L596_025914 [Steinernema carpocapsae]